MRAALLAAGSVAAVLCTAPTPVLAWSSASEFWRGTRAISPYDSPRRSFRTYRPVERQTPNKTAKTAEKTPPAPTGPLHVIISIDKQRATLFENGVPVASTAISSGTPGHPTPMGVFSVIQKDRHHISNLYDAPMPYMQRITWSGSALHEGPLPGYPASHGCVRLTSNFAQLLWKTTRLGARVIITRPEVAPVEIEHARLFVPKPKLAADPAVTSAVIKTANAANATAPTKLSITDGASGTPAPKPQPEPQTTKSGEPIATPVTTAETAKPIEIAKPVAPAPIIVDERPATMPAAILREANGRPISVFVSLKDGKLYVRQGWKPLFEAAVSFAHPEQPIGTHVYTAMGMKPSGAALRWTVVSIPSDTRRAAERKIADNVHKGLGRRPRHDYADKPVAFATPVRSASAALDRIVMPQELIDRISEMITPGSSLIVSDNRLSDETGEYTDFIVLTR